VKKIAVILIVLSLSGCSGLTRWTRLKPQEYTLKREGFSAELPKDWMRLNREKFFVITRDGILLEYIMVNRIRFKEELEHTKRKYEPHMLPEELAEIEIAELHANEKITRVQILSNLPTTLDGHEGFRLAYAYETMDGLKMRGIHIGFKDEEYIFRIQYEGAAQHYFETYRKDFDAFLKTFKVL
jgi:hypothetical protein